MPSRRLRRAVLTTVVLLLTAPACREREPDDRFNYNLAEAADKRLLLPSTATYYRAHDHGIRRGRTRATIVKHDDLEGAAEAARRREPAGGRGAPESGSASAVGTTWGDVGRSFLANLWGKSPAQGVAGAAQGGAARADLPAESAAAIERLVDEYNRAFVAKDFPALAQYCVARQQGIAQEFFDLEDEVNASLEAFLEEYDKTVPGVTAQAQSRLAAAFTPSVLSGLTASGTDAATGTWALAGGAIQLPVSFEREAENWRVVHPFVPPAAVWPGLKTRLEQLIDGLDELSDALATGDAVDQAEAHKQVEAAVKLLLGQPED